MPLVEYLIHYEYIKNELCENKDQPEMECDGKCHLKKQISKEAEDKNPVSNTKKQTISEAEVLFFSAREEFEFTSFFSPDEEVFFPAYTNLYNGGILSSVEHPPSFCA